MSGFEAYPNSFAQYSRYYVLTACDHHTATHFEHVISVINRDLRPEYAPACLAEEIAFGSISTVPCSAVEHCPNRIAGRLYQ